MTTLERHRQQALQAKGAAMWNEGESLATSIDRLGETANRIADERNEFKRQRNELAAALQELLDATPTSCEDRALNEAQRKAEKLLQHIREANERRIA